MYNSTAIRSATSESVRTYSKIHPDPGNPHSQLPGTPVIRASRPPVRPPTPHPPSDATAGCNSRADTHRGRHDDPRRDAPGRLDPGPDTVGDDDAQPFPGSGRAGRGRGAHDPRAGPADAVGEGAGREEQASDGRGLGCDVPAGGVS